MRWEKVPESRAYHSLEPTLTGMLYPGGFERTQQSLLLRQRRDRQPNKHAVRRGSLTWATDTGSLDG
jgi:hypothetical protein